MPLSSARKRLLSCRNCSMRVSFSSSFFRKCCTSSDWRLRSSEGNLAAACAVGAFSMAICSSRHRLLASASSSCSCRRPSHTIRSSCLQTSSSLESFSLPASASAKRASEHLSCSSRACARVFATSASATVALGAAAPLWNCANCCVASPKATPTSTQRCSFSSTCSSNVRTLASNWPFCNSSCLTSPRHLCSTLCTLNASSWRSRSSDFTCASSSLMRFW
mmetsp:Transcript_49102/g.110094  ORF Transcript_49102/g.110094 Transcript_49102/m.110094 type:complete len:221 (-) Transcript_49102:485-1147(-)